MTLPNNKAEVVGDHMVSQRVIQVIEAISDYSDDLTVEWIPPGNRGVNDSAFRIIHTPVGREPYVVFHVKDESEFDTRVLKRIIHGDQRSKQLEYGEIEAAEKAAELVARRRYLDSIEEAHEMAAALIKTNKSTYKFDKNHVYSDIYYGNQATKPTIL